MQAIFGEFSPMFVIGFFCLVVLGLLIDLKAHSADKPVSVKDAAIWSTIWIGVALCFAGYIAYQYGVEDGSLFLAGYFLEKSLSVDNLFVIMAIFGSFSISDRFQHRTLYYGILGAIVFRMIFIAFGATLAAMSKWVLFGFGMFVLYTAWGMARKNEAEGETEDYSNHIAVRVTRKFFGVSSKLDGHNFFTKENGKRVVTPLFLTLACVEVADVMFAFDSVPAVIAVTQKPILVYTSNIFAILGLRSLYFLLVAAKKYLIHLEKAVIGILVFIGGKMITATFDWVHVSPNISLAIVLGGLLLGITASLVFPEKEELAKAED